MIFWKLIATIGCCLLMAACGEKSAIQDAVKSHLKDPDSAKFEQLNLSDDKQRACIEWNAKNSMGGYGNWAIATLMKTDAKWEVTDLEGGQADQCNESDFKDLDAEHAAKLVAKEKGIELLQRARNVSHEAAVGLAAGECTVVYRMYVEESGMAAKYPLAHSDIPFAKTALGRAQAGLEAGKCEMIEVDPQD